MSEIDFVETTKKIVAQLNARSMGRNEDERIRYIYNEAINDAINWVAVMGEKNPDIYTACMRLEENMREWLPLRIDKDISVVASDGPEKSDR